MRSFILTKSRCPKNKTALYDDWNNVYKTIFGEFVSISIPSHKAQHKATFPFDAKVRSADSMVSAAMVQPSEL